jgi:hypothetical protein
MCAWDYATYSTAELAVNVRAALGGGRTAGLLANHGRLHARDRHRPSVRPHECPRWLCEVYIGMQTAAAGDASAITATGIDHLAFGVPDVSTLEALRADLAAVGFAPGGIFEEVVSHNLRVTDRDGLTLVLTAPKAGNRRSAIRAAEARRVGRGRRLRWRRRRCPRRGVVRRGWRSPACRVRLGGSSAGAECRR